MKKKLWRESWLGLVGELTSLELQKNSKINITRGNAHRSFYNAVNVYFNDLLFGFDYEFYIKENYITQAEYEIIKDWHNELDKYILSIGENPSLTTLLLNKDWLSILHHGVIVKHKLKRMIPEYEKKHLE